VTTLSRSNLLVAALLTAAPPLSGPTPEREARQHLDDELRDMD
jgi:hypothetical protein